MHRQRQDINHAPRVGAGDAAIGVSGAAGLVRCPGCGLYALWTVFSTALTHGIVMSFTERRSKSDGRRLRPDGEAVA